MSTVPLRLAVGTQVVSTLDERLTGKITGYTEVEGCVPVYIVDLDKGFWAIGKAFFTKLLVCHPDSIITKEQWDTQRVRII